MSTAVGRWDVPYLDSHCHVQARQFNADRAAVIERAIAAGVGTLICASDDESSSRDAVALAHAWPQVWATIGVHPHVATSADGPTLERLRLMAADERVVAYGEIGLDYFRDLAPRPEQRDAFVRQLALAREIGLPVVIHSREAADDTFAILRDWLAWGSVRSSAPGVIHCFGYDADWAERFLALGFYISIPGTVTYPKATAIQAVAASVLEDRLLVETDCPYLTPQPWRGTRNEPAYLVETVRTVAALRGVDAAGIGRATASNARYLFGLSPRAESAGGMRGSR